MSTEPISKNKVTWDAEKDYPELCEKVRAGLQEIRDPELGLNVIQLGLIRNLTIKPDSASVKMILTTPYCPYGPAMLEITRLKVEEILQRPTTIEMGMEPWDFSYLDTDAQPLWGMY